MTAKFLRKLGLGWKRITLAIAIGILILCFSYLRRHGLIVPEKLFEIFSEYPRLSPALFIFTYIILSLALAPTLPLNLGAGFLWGPALGSALCIAGATFGAICAFLVARYLARDYLNRKFRHSAWLWLRDEIEKSAWKSVAFTRINPIFSFGPLNYFYGITSISLPTFTWSTVVFSIPHVVIFCLIGNSIEGLTLTEGLYSALRNLLLISAILTSIWFLRVTISRKVS